MKILPEMYLLTKKFQLAYMLKSSAPWSGFRNFEELVNIAMTFSTLWLICLETLIRFSWKFYQRC